MSTASPWQYFTMEELTCHCGCGQMKMNADFMEKAVKLRQFYGAPWVITSGYRCPEHDEKVGTSTTPGSGPHTTGRALDINIFGSDVDRLMGIIYHELRGIITGKGVMQIPMTVPTARLIHIDDWKENEFPGHPRPGLWTYPALGGG